MLPLLPTSLPAVASADAAAGYMNSLEAKLNPPLAHTYALWQAPFLHLCEIIFDYFLAFPLPLFLAASPDSLYQLLLHAVIFETHQHTHTKSMCVCKSCDHKMCIKMTRSVRDLWLYVNGRGDLEQLPKQREGNLEWLDIEWNRDTILVICGT